MRKQLGGVLILSCFFLVMNVMVVLGAERTPTPAEKLTVFLPEEMLGFIATSGGDYLKEPFERSSLGKVWAEPSVQEFYQKIKTQVLKISSEEMCDQDDKAGFDAWLDFSKTVLRRPVLVCVAQKAGENPTCDSIYGFLLVEGGERKAEIEAVATKLAAVDSEDEERSVITLGGVKVNKSVGKDEPVILWGWVGNYFVLSVNDERGEIFERVARGDEAKADTKAVWNRVPATNDLAIKYVDFQKIGKLVEGVKGDDEDLKVVKDVLDSLGLGSVRTMSGRGGFSGRDLVSDGLIEIAGERRGIFAHLKTIDLAEMDKVPADVISAFVYRVDFAGLYDTVMEAIKTASEKEYREATATISTMEQDVGIEFRRDLAVNLEGTVSGYAMKGLGFGFSPGQAVYLFKLKDSKAMEATILKLEKYVEGKEGQVEMTKQEVDGRTYHFLMIPQVAMMGMTPTWVIEGDRLILGTNMQAVNTALAMWTSTQPSQVAGLRETPEFKQVTKNLPKDLVGFMYVDHKQNMRQTMQMMGQFWPMMTMGLQKEGKMKLPMMLPPAEDIVKHMGSEASYCWFDGDGLRTHGEGPVNTSSMQAAAVAVGAAVMLPAMGKGREAAKRGVSASNMRQIMLGLHTYALDNNGIFPDDLNVLIEKGIIPEEILKSPLAPARFEGESYIYVNGLDADCDPRYVVIYENPAYLCDGTNVGQCDAAVMWMKPEEFVKALQTTYEKLGKPMPTIEFTGKKSRNWFNWCETCNEQKPLTTKPSSQPTGVNLERKIPFKCTDKDCGEKVYYTIGELQKMPPPGTMGPMMGPMVLKCPKCNNSTLTQAVECPNCGEVFIMKMDPQTNIFDDKCPSCGVSYAKVWQEKYRLQHGKK
jgi:hypothetical protein